MITLNDISPQAKLIAPHYFLGEYPLSYNEIEQWRERASQFSMIEQPSLWGWGHVYKTSLSTAKMAFHTAQKTLAEAHSEGEQIDTLLICSTRFHGGPEEHTQFLREITQPLGLEKTEVIGITLGRCTNLIKALRIAHARILSSQSKQVLVITTDRITCEAERLENFALFSDGAASCLVVGNDDPRPGFNIIASAEKQDLQQIEQGLSVELAKAVNQVLFSHSNLIISDVELLFHPNVYLPLCNLKEMQAGYRATQLYTDNITRIGHCFAADPLINLVDAQQHTELRTGGFFQLVASIPGARASLLLQKGHDT